MAERAQTQILGNAQDQYATREEFRKILDEDLNRLYQLSFLLTADHQKAERCFVASIEDCTKENHVFREWARAWTIRIVVENAIRDLSPRPTRSNSSSQPSLRTQGTTGPIGYFDADSLDSLMGLPDFDRFVFVLRVLERYPENECALLLGSLRSQVREACACALKKLARID
jgi:DNA-directed RNA polymerase specialized sigma24 family protein